VGLVRRLIVNREAAGANREAAGANRDAAGVIREAAGGSWREAPSCMSSRAQRGISRLIECNLREKYFQNSYFSHLHLPAFHHF
jgi:hypothetical protein